MGSIQIFRERYSSYIESDNIVSAYIYHKMTWDTLP